MSKEDKALQEKNLGQEAHKRKDYEVAISHYSNAMKLNPKEMSFIYHLAKIKLEQKSYAECTNLCTKAIKVGKEQKANVKMVAKAMAMRGRAHKELGERDKYEEDIEKAMKFLFSIAQVKLAKEQWWECMDFSMRACRLGRENDFIEEDLCRKSFFLVQKAARKGAPEKDTPVSDVTDTYLQNLKTFGEYAAYERDFESAFDYYREGAKLNPKDMSYLNGIASVHLEQGAYSECIDFCNKALKVGEENGTNQEDIENAIKYRDRAQELLGKASEVTGQLQNGLKLSSDESVPLPEVQELEKFIDEIRRYFRANRLDLFDLTDIYKVSMKLYESKNYKGCIYLCHNAKMFEKDESSRRLAKVRALEGKAHRRDFGWHENFDACLADDMKTKGGTSDHCMTVEAVQRILTDMSPRKQICPPQEAEMILSMADVFGDRKVSQDQIKHVATVFSFSRSLAPVIVGQKGLSEEDKKRLERMCK